MKITYECHNTTLCRKVEVEGRTYHKFVEVNDYPIIGEKYMVVHYCDMEHEDNYTVEVTEETIDDITFGMNDPDNDITEYILVTE